MDTIGRLCEKYTELTSKDVEVIRSMADMLQLIADLEDSDIFIDCPTAGEDAIVVAEAKPTDAKSAYQKSVVGMLALKTNEPAVARTLEMGISTKRMKALSQEAKQVIQTVQPIINDEKVIGVLIREVRIDKYMMASVIQQNDITDSYEGEEGIEPMMLEFIDEGLMIVDGQGMIRLRNKTAKEMYLNLGYLDDPLGQPYRNFRLVDYPEIDTLNDVPVLETQIGDTYLNIRHIPLDKMAEGGFLVILHDMTKWHMQQKELMLKSAAIREIHHRVKNNLQTIASLLNLQCRRADNDETKNSLQESMNRILSIASTHEILAKNGLDEVKLVDVISNLRENALRNGDPFTQVKICITGDDFRVTSDLATSIALVLNELIQNAMKHAFEGRSHGQIEINIKKGLISSTINVIDNGTGFDVSQVKETSLGLSIVKSIVKDKLHGSLDIESGMMGTVATIEFSNRVVKLGDVV